MYDNIERELKLLVDEKAYNELLRSYDFHNPIIQTNTYFDTDNQDVKKQHGAVRIRTIQDKKIFTLKIRKDEYTHYEFEHGELCLDKTDYKNHTDYEIEYEYTSDHDGIHFFNSILKKYDLKWIKNCPSKIARALND